jgi:hypothetical protein
MALNRFDALLRAASTVDFSFRQRYTSPSTTAQQASAKCFGHLDSLKREKIFGKSRAIDRYTVAIWRDRCTNMCVLGST